MVQSRKTFLQLCNRVKLLTGDFGYEDRTSIAGFEGEQSQIPIYVEMAWSTIGNRRRDWLFLRVDNMVTEPLISGENQQPLDTVLPIEDYQQFSHWYQGGNFRIIEDSNVTFGYPSFVDYDEIRKCEPDLNEQGFPIYVSIMPNFDIWVWPAPILGDEVRIRGDYYKQPQRLTCDTDVTDLPPGLQDVVIHRALLYYAQRQQDTFHRVHHEANYNETFTQLTRTQAPVIQFRNRVF